MTLGQRIATRRIEKALSISGAARAAKVHRLTWTAWEKDASVPEDFNYTKIEAVLDWRPGDVAHALQEGRAPTVAERDAATETDPGGLYERVLRDEVERELFLITELPEENRWAKIFKRRQRLAAENKRSPLRQAGN